MLYYILQVIDNNGGVIYQQQYYSLRLAMRVGHALTVQFPLACVKLLNFDTYGHLVDIDVLGVE